MDHVFTHFWPVKNLIGKLKSNVWEQLEKEMRKQEIIAMVLEQDNDAVSAKISTISEEDLPEGDVTVRIDYSTLNYKDAMILKGIGKLVRKFPHVPGVDFSGVVEKSSSAQFSEGDRVVLNGWRVGEAHWGGYSQKARVNSQWLVHVPDNFTNAHAMGIGTAGYTAMLAISALEKNGLSVEDEGEVLVTGAAGGVGSIAVAILSSLGYRVAASTGREEAGDYLVDLGAKAIISRKELEEEISSPLSSQRWSGVIDNVGGVILGNVLGSINYHGACAAVGNTNSNTLEINILPFLLRGISIFGIDSVMCPLDERIEAWKRLSQDLPVEKLSNIMEIQPLSQIMEHADKILSGSVRGRVVIDVNS